MTEDELFWREWFKCPEGLGREVFEGYGRNEDGKLLGSRGFLTDYPSFLSYIQRMHRGVFPCWASVLLFQQRDAPVVLEKLYFDFDSKINIELAWSEARDFAFKVRRFYNADSLLCFSGNKGYNVYVWLQKPLVFTKESNFAVKQVYTKIQDVLLKGVKYGTLDPNPLGDVKRVSRVPYSIHEKSGSHCVPVSLDREPLVLQSLKGPVENGLSGQLVEFCLRKLEEEEEQNDERKKRWGNRGNSPGNYVNSVDVRPCVQAAVNLDLVEKQGTKMRLAIAREFLAAKWEIADIVLLFKNQANYSEKTTEAYIKRAKEEAASTGPKWQDKAKPFKCKTIFSLGFCLQEKCALWRWKTNRGIEL